MELNNLAQEAHKAAVDQGFYEVNPTKEQSILLIGSEVYEAMEADRKSKYCQPGALELVAHSDQYFKGNFEVNIKDTFEDELADTVIRLLDYAGFVGYEIEEKPFILFGKSINEKFIFLLSLARIVNSIYLINRSITDAIHYIFKYCKLNNIDIEKHIELKMKYNLIREYKNGKKY